MIVYVVFKREIPCYVYQKEADALSLAALLNKQHGNIHTVRAFAHLAKEKE